MNPIKKAIHLLGRAEGISEMLEDAAPATRDAGLMCDLAQQQLDRIDAELVNLPPSVKHNAAARDNLDCARALVDSAQAKIDALREPEASMEGD